MIERPPLYKVPTAPPAQKDWRTALSWVVVSAFSLIVIKPLIEQGLTLIFHQGSMRVDQYERVWLLVTGLGHALARALLRAMVLRRAFGRLRLWVPLSMASAMGLIIASPLLSPAANAIGLAVFAGPFGLLLAAAIYSAIAGTVTGIAEWYALRGVAQRRGRWIAATVAGTMIAQVGWELALDAGMNPTWATLGLEILRSSITGWLLVRFITERAGVDSLPADTPRVPDSHAAFLTESEQPND